MMLRLCCWTACLAVAVGLRVTTAGHRLASDSGNQRWAAHAERGEFSRGCQPFPNRRVVLVTVSTGFLDFFKNWLHHARPFLKETEQLLVMAEDAAAYEALQRVGNQSDVPFQVTTALEQAEGEATSSLSLDYGNTDYGSLVWRRPTYLQKLLRSDCTVLYVDVDTAWVQDPFVEVGRHPGHEMYVVQDDPQGSIKGGYLCTCFLYLQPARSVRRTVNLWAQSRNANSRKNQYAFNRVLRAGVGADYEVLPVERFPPGKLLPSLVRSGHANLTVVHANWVTGHRAKVCLLKQQGLWQPADDEACPEMETRQFLGGDGPDDDFVPGRGALTADADQGVELYIPAGKALERGLMLSAGDIAAYGFNVTGSASQDIMFSCRFEPTGESPIEVSPTTRVKEATGGSYVAPKIGRLVMVFDNSYSWVKPKSIRYECNTLAPEEGSPSAPNSDAPAEQPLDGLPPAPSNDVSKPAEDGSPPAPSSDVSKPAEGLSQTTVPAAAAAAESDRDRPTAATGEAAEEPPQPATSAPADSDKPAEESPTDAPSDGGKPAEESPTEAPAEVQKTAEGGT